MEGFLLCVLLRVIKACQLCGSVKDKLKFPSKPFWSMLPDFRPKVKVNTTNFPCKKRGRLNHEFCGESFCPRGFADAALGTAYLLLLFLEIFFEFHEKSG